MWDENEQEVLYLYSKNINKEMLYISERITIDESLCNGRPTIRGLGITVRTILEFIFAGDSHEDILYQYPDLEVEDIEACLQFALDTTDRKHHIKLIAA
jgi:uncharacterized protein (DUF433 family)